MKWNVLPDIIAIALLICAFASVARQSRMPVSRLWLMGWLMILLHFVSELFRHLPGLVGNLANIVLSASLIWAGLLYVHSVIPYSKDISSRWMLGSLLTANTFYISIMMIGTDQHWPFNLAAVLLGLCPLTVALAAIRKVNHPLRWFLVCVYAALSVFLLIFQYRPGNGGDLAWNAVMFTVYLACSVFFFSAYRRATAGAFVTIAGFVTWTSVFFMAPVMWNFFPQVHVESEVYNLSKYIVAVGMILLLLEDQVEHNKHLALHDELTGLPNRRLFQDRLANALDRARRTNAQAALLLIDLNHFKRVNDTLGHHVGDLLLQRVGAIFSGRVRRSDTVARTGGDEFSIILEEPTSRTDALHVCEVLLELLKEPVLLDQHRVQTGASIGIAIFPEDAQDMESLCIAADLRMYEEKKGLAIGAC
jgi:diguanylate cyclase (GGDEF)-like protein